MSDHDFKNHYWIRRDEIFSQSIQGEEVLMSLDSGEYFGLNGVAAFIWQLLQTPIQLDTLAAQIEQAFEIGRRDIRSEVEEFIFQLRQKGLVECWDANE